jgi:hypothetical protein
MSTFKTSTKSTRVTLATDLIAGTKQHFPNANETLEFAGATYVVASILTSLQTILDLRAAVEQAQATAKAKVAAESSQAPPLLAIMVAYVTFLRSRFGNSVETLDDFGLKPRKRPPPKTAEEKAVAAAKAKATRKARHTMSAKQKKPIKGNVDAALVVTPMASVPAAEAADGAKAATPAAAGANGATPTPHA